MLAAAAPALRPRHLVAGLAVAGLVAAALVLLVPAAREAASGIVATRLTPVSDVRTDLARVTAAQFRTAPWTGVGPGNLDLRYVDHTGARVRAVFTHDEYLQTAAETGLVGLSLTVGCAGRRWRCGWAARAHPRRRRALPLPSRRSPRTAPSTSCGTSRCCRCLP